MNQSQNSKQMQVSSIGPDVLRVFPVLQWVAFKSTEEETKLLSAYQLLRYTASRLIERQLARKNGWQQVAIGLGGTTFHKGVVKLNFVIPIYGQ